MPDRIKVRVNGAEHLVAREATVKQLVEQLGIPESGTAVELDGAIVPRSLYGATRLTDGQSLEIVRLVGGG